MNEKRIEATLRKLALGTLSRAAAAEALGCSERQVNRLMRANGVCRPRSDWRKLADDRRRNVAAREARLLELARRAIAGQESVAVHAKAGKVSIRTLYRWIQRVENEGKQKKNR